jgi:nicotinamidase-related amidase
MAILDSRAALIVSEAELGDCVGWGGCVANIAALLTDWRRCTRPIVLVRPGSASPESIFGAESFDDRVPGRVDVLVTGSVQSAFYGVPGLELARLRVRQVVLCGVHTNASREIACRMAVEAGFDVLLVVDATTTTRPAANGGLVSPVHTADLLSGVGLTPAAVREQEVA